ncbi:MAG: hypothetical protein AAFU61_17120 [Pseudomonadota bacterium]
MDLFDGEGGVSDALLEDASVLLDLDAADPEVLEEIAVGLAAGAEVVPMPFSAGATLSTTAA